MKITLLSVGAILFAATLIHGAPVDNLGVFPFVKLDRISYTAGSPIGTYNMQLCVNQTITKEDATVIIREANTEINIPGVQDPLNPECYDFKDVTMPKDNDKTRYDIHLHKGHMHFGPLGIVKYTFHKVDHIDSFHCDGVAYSRVVYPSPPVGSVLGAETCINGTGTCYIHGNFNTSGGIGSLCLPGHDNFTGESMVYCQPGEEAKVTPVALNSSSLNYGGHYDFAYDKIGTLARSETIVSVGGKVKISTTTNNQVPIKGFAPSTDKYTVCAVKVTKDKPIKVIGTSTIQDLNVHGYSEYKECQFTFENLYSKKEYKVGSSSMSTLQNLDCLRSTAQDVCYGYVDCKTTDKITVTYSNSENVIVVPEKTLKPEPEPTPTPSRKTSTITTQKVSTTTKKS